MRSRASPRLAGSPELVGGLARDAQIGLGIEAAALERAQHRGQQLGGARLDERVGDLDVGRLDELVDRGGAEVGFELGLDRLAQARLDLGAELLEGLELARRSRKLVVERRQDRLLELLHGRLGLLLQAFRSRVADLLRLAGAHPAQAALELLEQTPRAELDDVVTLRLSGVVDEVDDQDVAVLRGAVVDRHELGDRGAQDLELALDELLGDFRLRLRHLEPVPVGDLGRRLDGELCGEAERLVLGSRQLVVELRLRDGADLASAAAFQNQPPMWDSTASLKIRFRPTRASSTFCGTLPFRNPGIFVLAARSDEACSTACFMWSLGTSTSRRTRFSGSSSTRVLTAAHSASRCSPDRGSAPRARDLIPRTRHRKGVPLVR